MEIVLKIYSINLNILDQIIRCLCINTQLLQFNPMLNQARNILGSGFFAKLAKPIYNNSLTHLNTRLITKYTPKFCFAVQTIPLPNLADSISQGKVLELKKKQGEHVELDEIVAVIETDKVTIDIRSPKQGKLTKVYANEGDNLEVGKPFFDIDTDAKGQKPKQATKSQNKQKPQSQPSKTEAKEQQTSKKETQKEDSKPAQKKEAPKKAEQAKSPSFIVSSGTFERKQIRQPLSKIKQKMGQRLKQSQNTYASLTTFQEVDMSTIMDYRKRFQQQFVERHGIKLGFMSFFVRAAVNALTQYPIVNSVIDGNEIIHKNYIDISVAIATPTGLMVPVIRNAHLLKNYEIEKQIQALGKKGKAGKITLDDIKGGTFTISNGGVFGSLMGTPLINPPQSAILGMHATFDRPVVREGQIVIRPMMYLALTYDHRILDGRDAVLFLKKIKEGVEDPRSISLDI